MPRTGSVRSLVVVGLGALTMDAQVDVAQPAGLIDGSAASLSVDANGNLRITVAGVTLPANTTLPVVSLNGIADTLQNAGTVTAPGAGAAIATLAIPGAGVYDVTVLAGYGAVGDVANNMVFKNNGASVGNALYVNSGATTPPSMTRFGRVTVTGAINLTVNAIAAGAAGCVYIASITAVRLS